MTDIKAEVSHDPQKGSCLCKTQLIFSPCWRLPPPPDSRMSLGAEEPAIMAAWPFQLWVSAVCLFPVVDMY